MSGKITTRVTTHRESAATALKFAESANITTKTKDETHILFFVPEDEDKEEKQKEHEEGKDEDDEEQNDGGGPQLLELQLQTPPSEKLTDAEKAALVPIPPTPPPRPKRKPKRHHPRPTRNPNPFYPGGYPGGKVPKKNRKPRPPRDPPATSTGPKPVSITPKTAKPTGTSSMTENELEEYTSGNPHSNWDDNELQQTNVDDNPPALNPIFPEQIPEEIPLEKVYDVLEHQTDVGENDFGLQFMEYYESDDHLGSPVFFDDITLTIGLRQDKSFQLLQLGLDGKAAKRVELFTQLFENAKQFLPPNDAYFLRTTTSRLEAYDRKTQEMKTTVNCERAESFHKFIVIEKQYGNESSLVVLDPKTLEKLCSVPLYHEGEKFLCWTSQSEVNGVLISTAFGSGKSITFRSWLCKPNQKQGFSSEFFSQVKIPFENWNYSLLPKLHVLPVNMTYVLTWKNVMIWGNESFAWIYGYNQITEFYYTVLNDDNLLQLDKNGQTASLWCADDTGLHKTVIGIPPNFGVMKSSDCFNPLCWFSQQKKQIFGVLIAIKLYPDESVSKSKVLVGSSRKVCTANALSSEPEDELLPTTLLNYGNYIIKGNVDAMLTIAGAGASMSQRCTVIMQPSVFVDKEGTLVEGMIYDGVRVMHVTCEKDQQTKMKLPVNVNFKLAMDKDVEFKLELVGRNILSMAQLPTFPIRIENLQDGKYAKGKLFIEKKEEKEEKSSHAPSRKAEGHRNYEAFRQGCQCFDSVVPPTKKEKQYPWFAQSFDQPIKLLLMCTNENKSHKECKGSVKITYFPKELVGEVKASQVTTKILTLESEKEGVFKLPPKMRFSLENEVENDCLSVTLFIMDK